ncbi:MAG: GHKL domain-containing protein [Nitrosopumilaceae archaeon]|uniref:GHKL domain-containing protein n=1 Tax=Candidatus Nitrosomaritimum aestuariumsis TaxID=3342354 RepID=A0AC60W9U7_9ARCH|nr:GHKL domain-containing protein [Nitrosopumilaceae archaeon]MBA4463646.1 GHKL domain-containing protein [Nitrosopumilaceae archaeon]
MTFPYWILSILIIPTLIILGGVYIIESSYEQKVDQKLLEMKDKIFLQKQKIESDFAIIIKAQEGIAKQPEWKTLPHADLFDESIGGIPEDVESNKRTTARYFIEEFGFQSFGITTLDGQMYLLEPFSDQLSLSKFNFADREWFQGVLNSKETFVSEVFVSSATNHPIIVISTQLYSEEGDLIGMWGGGMDLEFLTLYLDNFRDEDTSIILLDNNGIVIANTDDITEHGKASENFLKFASNPNAYFYDSDLDLHVFHTTVKLQSKEWSLFATILEENFLVDAKQKKVEAYSLLGLMQIFLIVITYFVFKNVKKNHQLTQSLQENQDAMIKNERLSAIGELSAKIAHDIRNPLNNIKLSLDIINKKNSDQKLKEYFDKIDNNIFRISHQVNDVLNFLHKNRLKKEEVNIGNLIRTSIQNIPIPEAISLEISECMFKVNVDSIQLERAFTNLILNSVQAIGNKKGKITISIEEKDSICYITIEDSGTGIDSQNKDKIFEPLFTTKQQGTGLGLATVKNIIEMHNGSVNVEINPTRFIIKIPKY